MKHTVKVTIILLVFFVLTQIIGLYSLNQDIKVIKDVNTGEVVSINYSDTAIGERPDIRGVQTFWYIVFAVVVGTLILLLLIKYSKVNVWKAWFFLAVWLTVTVTLGIYLPNVWAYSIAFILAIFKIFRPNFLTHNISEVLMYSGIAILFVPLLDVFWTIVLLFVISFYDIYAVWHSKHMVKMANFQTQSKVFAGLSVPYKKTETKSEIRLSIPKAENYKTESKGEKIAILGGGDVAFPLIFSGSVMQWLILNQNTEKIIAFFQVQIITFFVTLSLLYLFVYGKKNKFYPAMPYITTGCLIGFGVLYLIRFLL